MPAANDADPARVAAHRDLRARRRAVVDRAEAQLFERLPYLRDATHEQLARTGEDLEYLAAFVEAAILTGDAAILRDYLSWLATVLSSRGVPESVIPPTLEAFADSLASLGLHGAAGMLRQGEDGSWSRRGRTASAGRS